MPPWQLPPASRTAGYASSFAGVWTDPQAARAELPRLLGRIKPRVTAWYPSGPGGSFASILRARPGSPEIIGTKAAEVSMELAWLTVARRVLHRGEEVLDEQVGGASSSHR